MPRVNFSIFTLGLCCGIGLMGIGCHHGGRQAATSTPVAPQYQEPYDGPVLNQGQFSSPLQPQMLSPNADPGVSVPPPPG